MKRANQMLGLLAAACTVASSGANGRAMAASFAETDPPLSVRMEVWKHIPDIQGVYAGMIGGEISGLAQLPGLLKSLMIDSTVSIQEWETGTNGSLSSRVTHSFRFVGIGDRFEATGFLSTEGDDAWSYVHQSANPKLDMLLQAVGMARQFKIIDGVLEVIREPPPVTPPHSPPGLMGSDISGPRFVAGSYYPCGSSRVELVYARAPITEVSEFGLVSWPKLQQFASGARSQLHDTSQSLNYVALPPESVLVLKWNDSAFAQHGYVAVVRDRAGNVWYRTNAGGEWSTLAPNQRQMVWWTLADGNGRVEIEMTRPTVHVVPNELNYRISLYSS